MDSIAEKYSTTFHARLDFFIYPMQNTILKKSESSDSSKPYYSILFLKREQGCQAVYEVCFQSVLKEDPSVISFLLDRKWSEMEAEQRDGNNKKQSLYLSDRQEFEIENHIKKFVLCKSHHFADHDTGKYLPIGLDVETTFNLYKKEAQRPVSMKLYQEVLKRRGLEFASSFLGKCVICETARQQLESISDPGERMINHDIFTHHVAAHQEAEQSLGKDFLRSSESLSVHSFGFQPSLPSPHLNQGSDFYQQPSWTYNFTVTENSNNNLGLPEATKMYMWDETVGGKTINEIASCLYEFLQDLPAKVKTVIFYSSSCHRESRSKILSMMFLETLSKHKTLNNIEHKFLPDGHSHNKKVLDDHLKILQKYAGNILQPQDWYNAFINEEAKSSIESEVVVMATDEFQDFKKLWATSFEEGGFFIDEDVECLRYSKSGIVECRRGWIGNYEKMTLRPENESSFHNSMEKELEILRKVFLKDEQMTNLMRSNDGSFNKKLSTENGPSRRNTTQNLMERKVQKKNFVEICISDSEEEVTNGGSELAGLPIEIKVENLIKLENGEFPENTDNVEGGVVENKDEEIIGIKVEEPPEKTNEKISDVKIENLSENFIESVGSSSKENAVDQVSHNYTFTEIFIKQELDTCSNEENFLENSKIKTETLLEKLSSSEGKLAGQNYLFSSEDESLKIECFDSEFDSVRDGIAISRNEKKSNGNRNLNCPKKCHLKIAKEDQEEIFNNYQMKSLREKSDYLIDMIDVQLNPQSDEKLQERGIMNFFVQFFLKTAEGRQNVCKSCFSCILEEENLVMSMVVKLKSQAIMDTLRSSKNKLEKETKQKSSKCNSMRKISLNDNDSPEKRNVKRIPVTKICSKEQKSQNKMTLKGKKLQKGTNLPLQDPVQEEFVPPEELKGMNTEILRIILKQVEHFIKSRKDDEGFLRKVTIQDMFEDYKKYYIGRASIGSYQNIVAHTKYERELRFLDKCKICKSAGDDFKDWEIRSNTNKRLSKHLVDCQSDLEGKQQEENLARKSETSVVCTFGFQSSFPIPLQKESKSIFNLTIQQVSNNPLLKKPKCFIWSQAEGKRSANEIASCLYEYLESLPSNVESVLFYSSSCSGESKSKALSMMFSHFLANNQSLKRIDHKYLYPGHFRVKEYLDDQWMEKIMRDYVDEDSNSHDWYKTFEQAAKSNETFDFVFMTQDKFYDFDRLWKKLLGYSSEEEESYLDEEVRWMRYLHHGFVYVKTTLKQNPQFKCFYLSPEGERLLSSGRSLGDVKLFDNGDELKTEDGKKDRSDSSSNESCIKKEELDLEVDYYWKQEKEEVGEPPSKIPR